MIRTLTFACAAMLMVAVVPKSSAVLVAHYEFESGSALGLDSAGGDHNGVPTGNDSFYSTSSRLGTGALALDGTGTGLRLDNSSTFQGLTTFTIAAFVRPDLDSVTWGGGSVAVGRVFGSVGADAPGGTQFGDGNGYGFGLLDYGDVGGLRYTSFLVTDYDLAAGSLPEPLQDDEWAHVAVVVTGGESATAEFYVNGVSVGTLEGGNPNPTTDPFHIGASGGGNTDSYAGLMDDVRFYDEALDASAIAALASPAGTGQQGLYFSIDRSLGTVTLNNDSSFDADIRGYSLTSSGGRFESGSWLSIAENYDQGNGGTSIDPDDDWIEFSSGALDLSEGTQGEVTLSGSQTIDLGAAWRKGSVEDVQAEVLLADGTTLPVPVEFTGNGGNSWLAGDLDFDNDVDLADFALYNAGLFTASIDPETTDAYLMGDLDGDFDNDFFDFLQFKNAYVAAGGNPAALSFGAAVPEPASLAILGFAAVGGVLVRSGRRTGRLILGYALAIALCVMTGRGALADFTPVFEYSFPASYDGTVTAVVDQSSAGNNATLDILGALVDNRPAGFDASLMSLTGSNGGHGATDGIDLLENAVVDNHGGYMMDVWMQWEGIYTGGRKLIDYAGTEFIYTAGGDAEAGTTPVYFRVSGTLLGHTINANEWYHVQGVFDSGNNQTDANGDLLGDAYLYVDGVLVDSAFGVTKTAFGDSLDRPIGINRWGGGGGEWNQGLIFNPSVYLGKADEPMRLTVDTTTGATSIDHLPVSLLEDGRDIDFYQITSASGALTTGTWDSLADSGSGGSNAADYNGDGAVNIADYTVWRNTLGSTGSGLAADGNGDDVVDVTDYTLWKDNFGATGSGNSGWAEAGVLSSSLVGESYLTGSTLFDNGTSVSLGELWDENSLADPTTDLVFQYHVVGESGLRTGVIDLAAGALASGASVPEPSSLLMLSLAVIGLVEARRRSAGHPAKRSRTTLVSLAAATLLLMVVAAPMASATVTNDRLYLFGESSGDGGADGVYVVDSAFEATFDEEYDSGNLSGTAHDLLPFEFNGTAAIKATSGAGPQFTSVAGRPLSTGTPIGVQFDGVNDMLVGARLGLPQTSASSVTGNTAPPTEGSTGTGPFDYSGITRRGFQLWVNPDETNAVFGTTQQAVVMDSSQHGVLISNTGNWMLSYNNANVDSGVPVKTDSVDGGWSHVMVVSPNGGPFVGGILYVDGIAVAAEAGGYTNNDFPLVIGASNGSYNPTAVEPDPVYAGGTTNYFAGALDEMSMFVLGTSVGGADYGTFNLATDNEYVANALLGYGPADFNGDGLTTDADVNSFRGVWGRVNLVNGLQVGDLATRFTGDFNFDGAVNLDDWQILTENYTGSAALDLDALLAGQVVPEPSSLALGALIVGLIAVCPRQR